MGRVEGGEDLADGVEGLFFRQATPRTEDAGEGLSLDQLHGEVADASLLAGLVDGDDIRVGQSGGSAGLAEESVPVLAVLPLRPQEFEGDTPVQRRVVGPVDDPHAAPVEQVEQPIASDGPVRRLRAALEEGWRHLRVWLGFEGFRPFGYHSASGQSKPLPATAYREKCGSLPTKMARLPSASITPPMLTHLPRVSS